MSVVRTIFIGGLPRDCTERELHLLFFEGGGCEAIQVQYPPPEADPFTHRGQATAFVQFPTSERAVEAVSTFNEMAYDPAEPSRTIRVEMARQDFRRLPSPGGPSPAKRMRIDWPGSQWAQDSSTLFVGSLTEKVRDHEVESWARTQGGFVSMTMKDEGTQKAVAWVQYESPMFAKMALSGLAGTPLASIGRVPNVEVAKTDIGASRGRSLALGGCQPPPPATPPPAAHFTIYGGGRGGAGGGGGGGAFASATVFIGGLEPTVTEQEVYEVAMSQGSIVSVKSKGLGDSRATAWVQYQTQEAAYLACESLKSVPFPSMGRPANIEMARSDIRNQ
eukprot:TRINITY_DN49707_c0_g1_i1.p1 TRINITY_DN49707_c0_g1~~TRINITY_DN49707_c0_g1_i1.p1  ORF type:complete len:334 (-),score=60.37 TRINITY_DN49707_c0_g1_i1:35-1036(-)